LRVDGNLPTRQCYGNIDFLSVGFDDVLLIAIMYKEMILASRYKTLRSSRGKMGAVWFLLLHATTSTTAFQVQTTPWISRFPSLYICQTRRMAFGNLQSWRWIRASIQE
jgi:hypothetical protein